MLIGALTSFVVSLILGILAIPLLRRMRAGQTILKYVEEHKTKNGTPTMGGLFLVLSAIIVFFLFCGRAGRISVVSVTIGLSFMAVGFIDDFLKIHHSQNQGLKAYQKVLFQLVISIFAGVFAYINGITVFYLPFTRLTLDLGFFTVPIVALVFIAITNSVNLTDGLDGLAGGVSATYLGFIAVIIFLQITLFKNLYLLSSEYYNLIMLSACLVGAVLGFLALNVNKAKVFMGDTGSLSLGGFIGAISVFSSNSFFIPILGITFVMSSISVIIQVLHFKRTGKRIFLMAPLHHHFQHKNCTETQISYWYFLATLITGVLSVLPYL